MKKVYDVLMAVRNASGSNAKKAILAANSNLEELKYFLFLVYEPTISYYQTKIKPAPALPFGEDGTLVFDRTFLTSVVTQLSHRKITGNAANAWLGGAFSEMTEEWMREMLVMLIDRDVRAGISEGSINKTWPGLLTDVPYMRCTLPKNVDLDSWPWDRGVYSEIKYDGMYGNIRVYVETEDGFDGEVFIESRNGSRFVLEPFSHVVTGARRIAQELSVHFPDEEFFVLNGEFEMLDAEGKLVPRALGNGKLNSILQSGESVGGYTPQYKVWDFQPGTAFNAKEFSMPRRKRVHHLAQAFLFDKPGIELADIEIVHSYEDAAAKFKKARQLGLEGTIIKHPDSIWEDGTSKHQVKMKAEVTVELRIMGFNPGSGKNADTFGSISCASECGQLEVDVNGRTDEMRQDFSDNREQKLGKIITVMSNDLTAPRVAGGKYSLFLPRFIEERLDKTVADTLDQIKQQFANAIKD